LRLNITIFKFFFCYLIFIYFKVNGIKGYWINKDEVANWQGKIPIEKFPINYDKYPKIIKKKNSEKIDHQQWIGVNYLRPPTPPKPGDIIIRYYRIDDLILSKLCLNFFYLI